MADTIPKTMRALALTKHCNPNEYDLATLPVPQITREDEILVRVRAASVNPIDVKMAGPLGKLMGGSKFPWLMGYDLAGEVAAVGTGVTTFKVGDEVYSRVPEIYRGSIAQYCLSTVSTTCLKPASLSFNSAAAIPLAALTALQAFDLAEKHFPDGLKGKTVLVPGGLSGTGSFAVQLAKNCFGAGKVVSTLSPGKIAMVEKFLGAGQPDVCVDYTKGDVASQVGAHSVDFMFDTQSYTTSALKVMKKGSFIVSISTVPSGTVFKKLNPSMPSWLALFMTVADWVYTRWTAWNGVGYMYMLMEPSAKDLGRLAKWVEEGKVKTVVGEVVKLEDIRGLREACQKILDGKGGVGKLVIEVE